jgi:hypothetical protein
MYLQNYDSCRAAILHQAGPYFCSTLGETTVKEAAVVVEIQALQNLMGWRPDSGRQVPPNAKFVSQTPPLSPLCPSDKVYNTPKSAWKNCPSFCTSVFHKIFACLPTTWFFQSKSEK